MQFLMDDRNLPPSYGKTRLVLLAVDPYLIHAYWEVTPERLIEAEEQAGDAQPVLRFYKSGTAAEGPEESFDIEIDLRSRSWYVHLWSAEESYWGDLALKKKDGTLISLARVGPVRMPRAQPAIAVDERFMRVETTQGRAEIVPPPTRMDRPPDSVPAGLSPINTPRPIPKALDSAEIVRHKLEELYASLHRPPEPTGTESELAAAVSVLPGQAVFDLTEMAEAKLADTPSSGALQGTREGVGSDQKK